MGMTPLIATPVGVALRYPHASFIASFLTRSNVKERKIVRATEDPPWVSPSPESWISPLSKSDVPLPEYRNVLANYRKYPFRRLEYRLVEGEINTACSLLNS